MGTVDSVFLDASALIYLLEGEPQVREAVTAVLADLRSGTEDPALAISALSLLECRVRPLRQGDNKVLARYDEFFSDPGLIKVSLAERVLERATQLRADHGLKTPDAIQAASALALGEGVQFVTGDKDFGRLMELTVHQIRV